MSNPIPFVSLADPRYRQAVVVSPLVRRVIADNPSKFTYLGTGTYIVGGTDVAVIDPGPVLDSHRDALVAALAGCSVRAILVTHCHADHSPLAEWLKAESGAPTVAFGPHPRVEDPDDDDPITGDDDDDDGDPITGDDDEGRNVPDIVGPSDGAQVQIEESTDFDFDPDQRVADGELAASGRGWTLTAVHTPGHTSNHMCFSLAQERTLFTGDHIMGWSTTVIGPPDGDMAAYIASLRKVVARNDAVFMPTHGAPVTDPQPYLAAFIAHRLEREAQVLAAVRAGETSIRSMVKLLYADVRRELHKPAARSVLAHLIKLADDGQVAVEEGAPRLRAVFRPA